MNILIYVAFAALALAIVAYAILAARAHKAAEVARRERNVLYRNCFLNGLAGMLAKMTMADGSADGSEIAVAERLFREMGISGDDVKSCLESFSLAQSSNLPVSYYASLFAPYSTRESRILVYEVLWDITAADGKLDPKEDDFLHGLLKWLELDETHYQNNLASHAAKFDGGIDAAIRAAGTKLDRASRS